MSVAVALVLSFSRGVQVTTVRPALNQCDLSVGGQDTQCGPRDAAIKYNLEQNITCTDKSHC